MLLKIGLETSPAEGRTTAWLLDFPGAFAYGTAGTEATLAAARALIDYQIWMEKHTPASWLADLGDFDVALAETWQGYMLDENFELARDGQGSEVGAWFRHDWKPLSAEDVRRALLLLEWTRADLLASVSGLTQAELDEARPAERWAIGGILNHVGGAEWWYLDRLGLAKLARPAVPKDPFERLALIRAILCAALPALVGVEQVVGRDGELWSPRKLVRRALWHERDHTDHIYKLRFGLG
jgi:hypothetical protein